MEWRRSDPLPFRLALHCWPVRARMKRKRFRKPAALRRRPRERHRRQESNPCLRLRPHPRPSLVPQSLPPPQPSPTPVLNKEVVVTPKVSGKTSKEGPPKGKGVRERRPFIPPGESAPDHRGKPNAQGELYPGFRQSDSRYCEACEQLRRGFKSATKAHRPKAGVCAWAPMAGKA